MWARFRFIITMTTLFNIIDQMFRVSFISTMNEALFPVIFLSTLSIFFIVAVISGLRLLISAITNTINRNKR